MNPLAIHIPCKARTCTSGDEQFEESGLTIRPWLPGIPTHIFLAG